MTCENQCVSCECQEGTGIGQKTEYTVTVKTTDKKEAEAFLAASNAVVVESETSERQLLNG